MFISISLANAFSVAPKRLGRLPAAQLQSAHLKKPVCRLPTCTSSPLRPIVRQAKSFLGFVFSDDKADARYMQLSNKCPRVSMLETANSHKKRSVRFLRAVVSMIRLQKLREQNREEELSVES